MPMRVWLSQRHIILIMITVSSSSQVVAKISDEMQIAINDRLTAIMSDANGNNATMPILDPANLGKTAELTMQKVDTLNFAKAASHISMILAI